MEAAIAMNLHRRRACGFSLVEMAVVTAILALLIGSFAMRFSIQMDVQKEKETRKRLETIQTALIGYAVLNSFLPCPDTDDPPNGSGIDDCGPTTAIDAEGGVPWKDLGLSEAEVLDAWASRVRYRVDKDYTSPLTELANPPDTNAGNNVSVAESDGANITNNAVVILVSYGKNKAANGDNGDADAVYTQNTPRPDFDDITDFLPVTLLLPPLVNAGRWPPP